MNIGIDKNMIELGKELRRRGFHVIEMDYRSNYRNDHINSNHYNLTNSTIGTHANSAINSNLYDTHDNVYTNANVNNDVKTDICIYCEDVSKHDYFDCVNSRMLKSFIPNKEGALLINSSNKTIDEIIHIIESRVYSPIF